MTTSETTAAYVAAFVDELARAGVSQIVICPGSRSTPLAMMFAEHPAVKVWMHVDERSAGYFALGMAKAHRQTVALLCSSGTAAANFFPAVVEAYTARVPLLVLTADRPHELRDVGAPQAINQIELYGKYTKWFVEMAVPEQSDELLRYARMIAQRAAATTMTGPMGPVHLNFPFREPLVPEFSSPDVWEAGRKETADASYVSVSAGVRQIPLQQLEKLADELRNIENGLIVCGPNDDPQLTETVVRLAELLRYPVLADPLSQLRSGPHDKQWIMDSYDTFLRNERIASTFEPNVVIRIGAMPVSKAFLLYMKRYPNCRQIVVDADAGWRDPTLLASDMIYADPVDFCKSLTESLDRSEFHLAADTRWGQRWQEVNELTRQALTRHRDKESWFEGQIFLELAECLPDPSILFVGNSMPVRDLDTFLSNNERSIRMMANRGANGIDGIVSTALGASTVNQPLVLVIGDLSFYHDLNGLLAAKLHQLNLTVIVINNDGGGIFSFLPQAAHPTHFEKLFGTPLGLDYQPVVEMYGGSFGRVHSWDEFRREVKQSLATPGWTVIEVPTERTSNLQLHRSMWKSISELLNNTLAGVGR